MTEYSAGMDAVVDGSSPTNALLNVLRGSDASNTYLSTAGDHEMAFKKLRALVMISSLVIIGSGASLP